MVRLFIDMDGTLARFYQKAKCLEKYVEPGFFIGLKPYENVVDAIKLIAAKKPETDIVFLSASPASGAKEKNLWIKIYFPEFATKENVYYVFPDVGCNKSRIAEETFGKQIGKNDVLLDDYSKNLIEWTEAGGTAIKLINEVNARGWNNHNWAGASVGYDSKPSKIAQTIINLL